MTVFTGVVYPLVVTGAGAGCVSQPGQWQLDREGRQVVGSSLIGQPFDDPKFFWSRPSATGAVSLQRQRLVGLEPGRNEPNLINAVKGRIDALEAGRSRQRRNRFRSILSPRPAAGSIRTSRRPRPSISCRASPRRAALDADAVRRAGRQAHRASTAGSGSVKPRVNVLDVESRTRETGRASSPAASYGAQHSRTFDRHACRLIPHEHDRRRDPDALLARVQAEEAKKARGKLKIFFGAAPGVGKTYTMLEAGRKAASEGVDVLVGYIEPHVRPETQALVLGLDVLARRKFRYRGTKLLEFDLEAALAERPQLILVDELAHTNAPGMTHAKRWQDIEQLLEAGIECLYDAQRAASGKPATT